MRRIAPTVILVVVSVLTLQSATSGYTFGDWASDEGYSPGDIMPDRIPAGSTDPEEIDSLDGIGLFDWTTRPTTWLDLLGNQISSINTGTFNGLTNLQHLDLKWNLISSIESGDFSGLTNLQYLDLHSNQISSVEPGDFSGLNNLTHLFLSWNQISSIEPSDFSELANLTWLDLSSNEISSIESGDFTGLTNLYDLRMNSNQISSIESRSFIGLEDLDTLNLRNNQIATIESSTFRGLGNLEVLELSWNQISNIEMGVFRGMPSLKRLILDHNLSLTKLNLDSADFSDRDFAFSVEGNVNITSVSLRNTVLNQPSLNAILDGGMIWPSCIGIGELDGITELDLSGIDFIKITNLEPLYVMDDLNDLWLVGTNNLDASDLDVLLDNLETIEGTVAEGTLYMTQADFDAFNAAGNGLLATWNDETGHHIEFVIPGDFDFDGDVDGSDLLMWQQGSADPQDLALWQEQFGSTTINAIAVPEPTTIDASHKDYFSPDALITVTLVGPEDFNGDGYLTGSDFLKWQRGESPNPLSQSDLALWQANFEVVASPVVANSTVILEPSSIVLLLVAFTCSLSRKQT